MKITVVHKDHVRTFQQTQGESLDEFRGRALHEADIPEGDEYFDFEEDGHRSSGPVGPHCHGMKRTHHHYAQDDRLPGLFVLVRGKVYDYKEAPRGR